jgi:hypothetical protein
MTARSVRIVPWNVASAKTGWFPVPWAERKDGIGIMLDSFGADIICVNEAHFSFQTADILKALTEGDPQYRWRHISSPVGNDMFYSSRLFRGHKATEYPLGAQGRAIIIAELDTGMGAMTIANTHLPYNSLTLRTRAAKNAVAQIREVRPYVDVLVGDMNAASRTVGPLRVFSQAGWKRGDQWVPSLEMNEYPKQGKRLSHLLTRRARVTAARLVYTHPRLSDHRPTVYDVLI